MVGGGCGGGGVSWLVLFAILLIFIAPQTQSIMGIQASGKCSRWSMAAREREALRQQRLQP